MVLTKRICPITEVFLILQISPLILMTLMLDLGVKISGEIIHVSLSGVKELRKDHNYNGFAAMINLMGGWEDK